MVIETIKATEEICLSKEEYEDIQDYMERLKETVELLSNKDEMNKVKEALNRINSKEFLTKEEFLK